MKFSTDGFVKAKVHHAVSPGEALRIIRELQGLTQADLEALTGIAQANISALEHGTRQLGRERALILAKALKVHPSVLLFPDYDMKQVV